jgi:2,3-bisphosphoglycerate-independent phosphoglycerate mutase
VPFILVPGKHSELAKAKLRDDGVLADVAPTILELMGIPKPQDMEGTSLIVREESQT